MTVKEEFPSKPLYGELIALSEEWEAENSCHGYRKNTAEDIDGNRIFTARENGVMIGYLFGYIEKNKEATSVVPEGAVCFEVEEIYVKPEYRSGGVGSELFRFAEHAVGDEVDFIMLSTATKDHRAILHFYIDMLGMDFWNARLFKKL